MKKFLILLFVVTSVFGTLFVESQDGKTILLSKTKEPVLTLEYVAQEHGTSLIQNTQTFLFNITNLSQEKIEELTIFATFLNKEKSYKITQLDPNEKKAIFITFSGVNLYKNSELLPVFLKIFQKDANSWEIKKELLVNKRSLNFKLYSLGEISDKTIEVEGFGSKKIKKGQNAFFVPSYSEKKYTLTITTAQDVEFSLNINDELFISSDDKTSNNPFFEYKLIKIKGHEKVINKLFFSLPEVLDLKNKEKSTIGLVGFGEVFQGELTPKSDNEKITALYKNGELEIFQDKSNKEAGRISLYDETEKVFEVVVLPFLQPEDKQEKLLEKKEKKFIVIKDLNGSNFNLGDEVFINSFGEDVVEIKDEKKGKIFVQKSAIIEVLGDGGVFVEANTTKIADVYLDASFKKVAEIDKGTQLEGELFPDGMFLYVNKKWWTHASFLDLGAIKFVLKKDFLLRDAPNGKKVGKVKSFKEASGRFVDRDWILLEKIEDKEAMFFIHKSGVFIKGLR